MKPLLRKRRGSQSRVPSGNLGGSGKVVEEYNGEVQEEYELLLINVESGDSDSVSLQEFVVKTAKHGGPSGLLSNLARFVAMLRKTAQWRGWLKTFFVTIFLPQGYPSTVTDDYLEYQTWDTVQHWDFNLSGEEDSAYFQAFASSITGALATTAIFKGVGVGNQAATALAASITWLLKDGTGMVGRIVFAWARGTRLDSDCKKWRLVADILNDFAFCIDLLASHIPSAFFTPSTCVSSLLRAIVGVAGGATRTAIVKHQARRDNLADVSAKDGSQETLVNLGSLFVSLIVLPLLDDQFLLIWLLYFLCTFVHLLSNYRAVRSLRLDTLNQSRLVICVRYFIDHREALTIPGCNAREPIFSNVDGRKRSYGCRLSDIPRNLKVGRLSDVSLFAVGEHSNWIVFEANASDDQKFSAIFRLEYYVTSGRWPNSSAESSFRRKMEYAGWVIHVNQMNIDEWRLKRSE